MRVSEIINLHTVDIRKSCVHLRDKARGKRQMPLLGWLAASFRSWRKLRPQTNGGSSALIVSLSTRNFGMPLTRQHTWAIVSGYFAHLKLERREQLGGVDALRRAAASSLFRASKDAVVVCAILDMVGPSNKPVGVANLDKKIKEALAKADDQLNLG